MKFSSPFQLIGNVLTISPIGSQYHAFNLFILDNRI